MMMDMEEDKYGEHAVKCAAETLQKAEEIKKDPKMLALVKGELEKAANTIKSIKELRKVSAEKLAERDDEEEGEEEEEEYEKPELMTEEDKAAKQEQIKTDKNVKKMGLKK